MHASDAYNILVIKSEGKILLWRPRHTWEGSIKMNLKDVLFEGIDWIQLAQDRVQW
jgi:hypothetical protein